MNYLRIQNSDYTIAMLNSNIVKAHYKFKTILSQIYVYWLKCHGMLDIIQTLTFVNRQCTFDLLKIKSIASL